MNMRRTHIQVNNKMRQFQTLCSDTYKGVSISVEASFVEVTYKTKYNSENMGRVSCSHRILPLEKSVSFARFQTPVEVLTLFAIVC
jgi:hypothetical protein